jgi:putative protease
MLVGYVTHYYPKVKSGVVSLNHLNLKVGERIIVEGEHTFIEQDVESIQIKNKNVKMGKKGEEVAVVFNDIVRKNDKVFLIKKREV